MTAIVLSFFGLIKFATILVFVLAVIWVSRHYRSRRHERSVFTAQEETVLEDLSRIAEKMEGRLHTLEKIIEADNPKWRERI